MAPWHDCEQFHSQPDGAPSAADPPSGPLNVPANSRHVSPRGAPLACPLPNSARLATAGRHHRACAAASRRPHHHLLESGLARSPSPTHQPLCQRQRQSLRWIRAKADPPNDMSDRDVRPGQATAPDASRLTFARPSDYRPDNEERLRRRDCTGPSRPHWNSSRRRAWWSIAGLLLPVTLAQTIGDLRELVDSTGYRRCARAGDYEGPRLLDPGGVGAGGRRLH